MCRIIEAPKVPQASPHPLFRDRQRDGAGRAAAKTPCGLW